MMKKIDSSGVRVLHYQKPTQFRIFWSTCHKVGRPVKPYGSILWNRPYMYINGAYVVVE